MTTPRHAQLVAWLEDEGHSEAEIASILAKLDEYDQKVATDSVFDSIDAGNLDLLQIIREALAEEASDA